MSGKRWTVLRHCEALQRKKYLRTETSNETDIPREMHYRIHHFNGNLGPRRNNVQGGTAKHGGHLLRASAAGASAAGASAGIRWKRKSGTPPEDVPGESDTSLSDLGVGGMTSGGISYFHSPLMILRQWVPQRGHCTHRHCNRGGIRTSSSRLRSS